MAAAHNCMRCLSITGFCELCREGFELAIRDDLPEGHPKTCVGEVESTKAAKKKKKKKKEAETLSKKAAKKLCKKAKSKKKCKSKKSGAKNVCKWKKGKCNIKK